MSDLMLELGEFDGKPFSIFAEKVLTGRTAVIGMSGSGKSHLIGVLCEEMSKAGLSFIVIDPEGEYHTLKEKYEVVWACNKNGADVQLSMEGCSSLAESVVNRGARLILDTSESSNEIDMVTQFLDFFYEAEDRARVPILLIVEEADRFVPQSSGTGIRWLHEISRRGRKRGIGLVIATQRPAMVDKNVLSQCGSQIIGRLRTENDLKAVSLFFHRSEMLKALPNMERGQFNVMGDISHNPCRIMVRQRVTSHSGGTPKLAKREEFKVRDFVSNLDDARAPDTIATPPPVFPPPEEDSPGETRAHPPTSPIQTGLLGMEYSINREEALRIADREIGKSLLTGKTTESIEVCEMVYWPMFLLQIQTAKRGLLGLSVDKMHAIWDPVSAEWFCIDEKLDITPVAKIDKKLLSCNWKQLRVMRELTRQDLTTNDMVPKAGISVEDAKKAVAGLKKASLVIEGDKIGNAPMYRPLVKFIPPKPRELRTAPPHIRSVSIPSGAKVMPCQGDQSGRELVKGSYEDTDVTQETTFYMPLYKIGIRNRKTGVLRTIRINGITGSVFQG